MAKELKYLRKFDPSRDAHSNWQTADGLYVGWFMYSPFELQERYRDIESDRAAKALELQMQSFLLDRLAAEEILAFGVQISPELKSEAEQIPTILFQTTDGDIDWERDQISGLGRQYHDVRICLCPASNTASEEPIASLPLNLKRGGGRPSQYPEAREILQELYAEDPSYRRLSAARLLNRFNERYLAKFTPPGERIAPVSERALRGYLKDFRQELAGTGEN